MTGGHRPVTVVLALVVLGLIALGIAIAVIRTLGLFGSLDARLAAILLTALAVAGVIALGLRAVAANGERQGRWERRLRCYRDLLEGLNGTGASTARVSADLALLAGPGVVKTLTRLDQLASSDPSRPAAMAALLRELRRDLGKSSGVLSEAELSALLPPTPTSSGSNPSLVSDQGTR
jgi:hypothetical protein